LKCVDTSFAGERGIVPHDNAASRPLFMLDGR